MICDICVEGNIEQKGAYCMDGVTICKPCLTAAIVFYCEHHKTKVATNGKDVSESVKEARKEDNLRGWWA